MKNEDVYGEPTIMRRGNIVARLYTPILTDEERERRMNLIKQAAVRLVLNAEKAKEGK